MNSFRRILLVNILVLLIIAGGGFAGYYFYYQSENYLSTDNAKIDGQPVTITSIVPGQITDWTGEVGKKYQAGERIGVVKASLSTSSAAASAPAAPSIDITVPTDATIVQQSVVKNSFVAPGMPLAQAFDLDHLWVTANIKETDINDVKPGQTVDVYVDAFPGTTLSGRINKVGLATANTFSLLPSSNNTGNYTKVTQVIPVSVTLDGYKGLQLVPGMNVTVRIHK